MSEIFNDEYRDFILEKYNNLSEQRKLKWDVGLSKLIGIHPMTQPTGEIFNLRETDYEKKSR